MILLLEEIEYDHVSLRAYPQAMNVECAKLIRNYLVGTKVKLRW